LPDPVSPGSCLQVVLGVEVTVHEDDRVCTGQVDALATCGRHIQTTFGIITPNVISNLFRIEYSKVRL